jgi:hypothetical protein
LQIEGEERLGRGQEGCHDLCAAILFQHPGHSIAHEDGPALAVFAAPVDVHDHGLRFFGDPGVEAVPPVPPPAPPLIFGSSPGKSVA